MAEQLQVPATVTPLVRGVPTRHGRLMPEGQGEPGPITTRLLNTCYARNAGWHTTDVASVPPPDPAAREATT
jgi:hypothetical protein